MSHIKVGSILNIAKNNIFLQTGRIRPVKLDELVIDTQSSNSKNK